MTAPRERTASGKKEPLMRKITVALACIALFCFCAADASAFRCNHGKGLVSAGDAKARVRIECGPPDSVERVKSVTRGSYQGGVENTKNGRIRSGYYTEETLPVEKWYYNCGESDFLYVLTFEGDVLVAEETAGRGTGPSRCTY
jgi:hypothetical protein